MSELERVLASLRLASESRSTRRIDAELAADAARLLREQATALRTINERIAEAYGGIPDWWHDAECPEDDTCACPHAIASANACRLLGP